MLKLSPLLVHELGVQQCFGVVYHELTTLRRVYFERVALAAQANRQTEAWVITN